jgi:hypothetical protein
LIAAAGSNGVIVVWTAETLLEGESGQFPAPDAILSQPNTVNRLAWHPSTSGTAAVGVARWDGYSVGNGNAVMPEQINNDDNPSNRTSKGFLLRNQGVAVQSETIVFVAVVERRLNPRVRRSGTFSGVPFADDGTYAVLCCLQSVLEISSLPE